MSQVGKKLKVGTVVSNKMNKSIVVKVESILKHPLYKKTIKRSKKYLAHDEKEICKEGDTVRIIECRPLSRRKQWRLMEVLSES